MADVSSVVVESGEISCSGVVLDIEHGLVLTVGGILNGSKTPCFDQDLKFFDNKERLERPSVHVILKTSPAKNTRTDAPKEFVKLSADILVAWKVKDLHDLFQRVFPGDEWKLGETPIRTESEKRENCDNRRQEMACQSNKDLSKFVLLQVNDLRRHLLQSDSCLLVDQDVRPCGSIRPGDAVVTVGTPFGSECPEVFFNSLSKGIVSNVIGLDCMALLTDARVVPGCEGCPVFVSSMERKNMLTKGALYGITVAPFCWRQGELIGLTLVCSIRQILVHLRQISNPETIPVQVNQLLSHSNLMKDHHHLENLLKPTNNGLLCSPDNSNSVAKVMSSVVLVQCGRTWGSGFIVDEKRRLIVTCSHIISEAKGNKCTISVRQSYPNHLWFHAEVIFVHDPNVFDFALLRIASTLAMLSKDMDKFSALTPRSDYAFKRGENVFVIGYSIFGSSVQKTGPSLTSGVLSNFSALKGEVVLLQSTAAVHCGGSGGALVSMETGELLGMVTSNTKDANSKLTFPNINYSLPVNLIMRLIKHALSGQQDLDEKNKLLSQRMRGIWQLHQARGSTSKL
ncbi:peroxisomal leader peptide-processing protease-like [Nematostella vectensis]|uniref:peroxisomal leader peptide-processing protease-like n=1 Tax=Nematostella vectensis TaxID=45351 RepID=UPI002077241B|nr:peroxisomal leader peptide-processing protease-like [Nematostella vectensis]